MNRRHRRVVPLAAAVAVLLSGCGSGREERGGGGKAETRSSPPGEVLFLTGGLSAEDREAFYHLAEGSELIPYAWVHAVKNTATGKLFMDDVQRFGLIPDPNNPHRLPVGVTHAMSKDSRLLRVEMMGLNCAACHVSEMTYQGRRMRVDGGQALFYADKFRNELQSSLLHLEGHPAELIAFVWRLRVQHETENRHLPADRRAAARRVYQATRGFVAAEAAAADSSHASLRRWLEAAIAAERNRPPVDMLVGLHVQHGADSTTAAPRLPALLTAEHALRTADAIVPDAEVSPGTTLTEGAPAGGHVKQVESVVADVILTYRLLRSRIHAFRRIAPHVASSEGGPGRVDAFDVARNVLFPRDSVDTTAPVSYPFLWGFGEQAWLHYDANTNSVMQRNIGQAIGVGAAYDSTTMVSTLDPRHLYRLEVLARKLTPPRWPEEVFGRIDAEKARRGEALFAANCAGCHTQTNEKLFDRDSTGTDRNRLVNFDKPMRDGRYFLQWAGPALSQFERQAYRVNGVPADSQRIMSGPTAVWRTTGKWGVRPLRSVWATAPYLHNGSVPTLHDLLLPAAQRPKEFPVGHTDYDPVKLGYTTRVSGTPVWLFRTGDPGNSNSGHEYGTRLTQEERMALLEYLKGH